MTLPDAIYKYIQPLKCGGLMCGRGVDSIYLVCKSNELQVYHNIHDLNFLSRTTNDHEICSRDFELASLITKDEES